MTTAKPWAPPPGRPRGGAGATRWMLRKYYNRRPCSGPDDEVELVNCLALAREQTELACNMKFALITGVADCWYSHVAPAVRLAPGPGPALCSTSC